MTFALPQPNAAQFLKLKLQKYRPMALLAMGLGFVLAATPFMTTVGVASDLTDRPRLEDGVYLFGESPEPDQVRTTYMVAEVSAGRVIGGFYQPHSAFDCFHGAIAGGEMALTIMDSYEQTEHAFAMTFESRESIASQAGGVGEWVPSGFHAVTQLSPMAEAVLQTCRTHL